MKNILYKSIPDYMTRFLSLKCAGDVINAVQPVAAFGKEISEAMAIRLELRKFVLNTPEAKMKYTVHDLAAGNCLTGVLAAFTLPVAEVCAVDRRRPKRECTREGQTVVRRWRHYQTDLMAPLGRPFFGTDILVSSHPCKKLAERLVDMFLSGEAKALIMIPCCPDPESVVDSYKLLWQKGMSKYDLWSLHLAERLRIEGKCKVRLFSDRLILSPCRNVIVAER